MRSKTADLDLSYRPRHWPPTSTAGGVERRWLVEDEHTATPHQTRLLTSKRLHVERP
jgi:hypothetical protein